LQALDMNYTNGARRFEIAAKYEFAARRNGSAASNTRYGASRRLPRCPPVASKVALKNQSRPRW
jgi:hypothetical protein